MVANTGRVYAFEPNPSAYSYLSRNVAANGCRNVVPVQKAVSDRIGSLRLVADPVGPESFVTQEADGADGPNVEAIPLDDFFMQLGWPRVDIVKMNIEGGEYAALKGMTRLGERNPEMKLVMEFNPRALSRAGASRDQMEGVLRELGFRSSRVVEHGMKSIPPGDFLPRHPAVCNLLLTKS
jgi:FkbM family methyltransferase